MTTRILPLLLVAIVASSTASQADDKADWTPLFNGKDFTGWRIPDPPTGGLSKVTYVKNADDKVIAIKSTDKKSDKEWTLWEVKDGMIVGGGPFSHIFTEKEDYTDFHLKMVVKVNDKGNSGVFYRSAFRAGVPKGYEAQLNATHGDPVKTGSIYPNAEFGLDKVKKETCVMNKAAHGPDEFFTYEIICLGDKMTTLVNGAKQIEWTDPEHRFKKGAFALQGHDPGSIMTFKSVEVKILK
ncbi:MAG: 3-keto-disaccharide hydrolase [Gemmataceae bacterium]